jgi:hypothetical protein
MLDRFLERKIIPVFDLFPDYNLQEHEPEVLLKNHEVLQLPIDAFDTVERTLKVIDDLMGVDWLIINREDRQELLFAKVDSYQYIPFQAHLYVKHYIKFTNLIIAPYDNLTETFVSEVNKYRHFDELNTAYYSFIQKHLPQQEKSTETGSSSEPEQTSQPVQDDTIITPNSLAAISRKTDEVTAYKSLHGSIMLVHDYLRTNMAEIAEYHNPESDIAFKGLWHSGEKVEVLAFNLTDNRNHSAWLLKVLVQ